MGSGFVAESVGGSTDSVLPVCWYSSCSFDLNQLYRLESNIEANVKCELVIVPSVTHLLAFLESKEQQDVLLTIEKQENEYILDHEDQEDRYHDSMDENTVKN